MANTRTKSKSLPGPWKDIHPKALEDMIQHYRRKILKKTGNVWDQEQLYYAAKACALYRLMTGEEPVINEMKYGIYLAGQIGDIHILYKPIKYRGPFTRGYRYIKVDVPSGTYKIIKIKKKKAKKK